MTPEEFARRKKHMYYFEHREECLERSSQWYQANKEAVAEYKRRYYEANKEKWKQYAAAKKGKKAALGGKPTDGAPEKPA